MGPMEIIGEPEKKTLLLSIESWLVYREPYFMIHYNPYINWVGFHPLHTLNNQGIFHCSGELLSSL